MAKLLKPLRGGPWRPLTLTRDGSRTTLGPSLQARSAFFVRGWDPEAGSWGCSCRRRWKVWLLSADTQCMACTSVSNHQGAPYHHHPSPRWNVLEDAALGLWAGGRNNPSPSLGAGRKPASGGLRLPEGLPVGEGQGHPAPSLGSWGAWEPEQGWECSYSREGMRPVGASKLGVGGTQQGLAGRQWPQEQALRLVLTLGDSLEGSSSAGLVAQPFPQPVRTEL